VSVAGSLYNFIVLVRSSASSQLSHKDCAVCGLQSLLAAGSTVTVAQQLPATRP
jgi:hypothetical protein